MIPNPAVEIEDLVMHFGVRGGPGSIRAGRGERLRAVDGVSLRVERGQIVALVGESGSGKSTVGRCIARLHAPTSGRILLGGVDATRLSRRRLRPYRHRVSLIFQDPAGSLDPRFTVRRIVDEPLRVGAPSAVRRPSRTERRERVLESLERVGLPPRMAERYPHELSGGQRQRVGIARALVSRPDLLIADEPTSALDVSVQASVLNLLADLQRDLGFGCLFITHDLSAVEYLADQVAVMYLGKIVEYGSRRQIMMAPRHPYTQALLAAAPWPDPDAQRSRRRVLLPGELPSPVNPPSGCRFHTRCPVAVERCRTAEPFLGDNAVACHLVGADGEGPQLIPRSQGAE